MFSNLYDKLKSKIRHTYFVLLVVIREIWRPIGSISIAIAIFVNGVYLPIKTHTIPSLAELAALVAAFAPLVAIRGWENKNKE